MRFFCCVLLIQTSYHLFAQDTERVLSLDECIEIAVNRNLTIKQNQNNLIAAQSNKRQAFFNFLPNFSISGGYTIVEGTRFDNASGRFVSATTRQSNPELTGGLNVFNAFANHHLMNRRSHEYQSSYYQLEDSKLFTIANVIRSYLNVLVDLENLNVSNQFLSFLESQYEREKKRVSVGVGDLESVYNFQSQVATERLNNVNLENQYQSDLLALLQLLQLNDGSSVKVNPLDSTALDVLSEFDPYNVVLQEVLQNSFQLKSSIEAKKASRLQLSESRANRWPSIGLGAGYGSQFSTNNEGDYLSQIENFNYQYIGGSIQIPLLNGLQRQNAVDNARVSFLNAEIAEEQAVLDVTNATQRDYLDLVSAQTSYQTAQENYEALNSTFEFIKKRFETGNTDFYSYLESLNNKNRAESQLINAKYTIVLRKRILDLYRGR
ncbi:MAG: TolC family protein [Bacteroidota bacterium]